MIDTETLGTTPESVILSIAAVRFDRRTGDIVKQVHLRVSPNQPDRRIDQDTLRWWLAQPAVSISEAFGGTALLKDALELLAEFVDSKDLVWSQGTDFDFPLLQNAFESAGMKLPWKYWSKRDTRTVYDVCCFDANCVPRDGMHHNALSDCHHQIRCVVDAMCLANLY